MKVIILASGIGSRLKPLTDNKPKSLVKINSKTIIEHQLDILSKFDVEKIIVTTGPFEKLFKKFINSRYPNLNIDYVHNSEYSSTNYIYSLWLTKPEVDDDILLFHGDVFFSFEILKKVIDISDNGVLVNNKIDPPEKDFKAVIKNDRVVKIGVDFEGRDAFYCLPLYKFLKNDFLVWMSEIEKEVRNNNVNIYAEDAFNNVSNNIFLKPVYFTEEFCQEIDTFNDLENVRKTKKRF